MSLEQIARDMKLGTFPEKSKQTLREELLERATAIVLHGRTITYPSITSAEQVRNVMADLVAELREQKEIESLRDFAKWVDTWVSNPSCAYSHPALAGLFSQARDKIAALPK